MKKVIFDTNFLLIPAQFRVDIFGETERICDFKYEIIVLEKSVEELKKIVREQKGKNKSAAKLALALVKAKKAKIMKTEQGEVDYILAELSNKGYIIATQDKLLKKRLKKPIITLRQKKYLVLI